MGKTYLATRLLKWAFERAATARHQKPERMPAKLLDGARTQGGVILVWNGFSVWMILADCPRIRLISVHQQISSLVVSWNRR
jgi:hypothetical protein